MRKILYYDCFAGMSGDMNLGAMLDLGVDEAQLRAQLSALGLDHEFELRIAPDSRRGVRGLRAQVLLKRAHEHRHEGEHAHAEFNAHEERRSLRDIEALIERSGLSPDVRRISLAIFRKIAAAEARAHGVPIEDAHFHEVGALDAIVDVVGAAICRCALDVDEVWASPVELGGGFARCAHGLLPVPAPATAELLTGIPTTRGATGEEPTTPTGAAILATLVDVFTANPRLRMDKTAYGVGAGDPEIPNVLRAHLARRLAQPLARPLAPAGAGRPARLLQCDIDDMTAEVLGAVLDLLVENGAQGAHFTPIFMKKNRPGVSLSLVCSPKDEERFTRLLLRHTTTLGVKSFALEKTILETREERIETALGPVLMKRALLDGEFIRSKPELEDCREIAQRAGIPLLDVQSRLAAYGK